MGVGRGALSILNSLSMKITVALCPMCGKMIKVDHDGLFVVHKDKKRKQCPNSGNPYPPIEEDK